jgi:hypothetical protein
VGNVIIKFPPVIFQENSVNNNAMTLKMLYDVKLITLLSASIFHVRMFKFLLSVLWPLSLGFSEKRMSDYNPNIPAYSF